MAAISLKAGLHRCGRIIDWPAQAECMDLCHPGFINHGSLGLTLEIAKISMAQSRAGSGTQTAAWPTTPCADLLAVLSTAADLAADQSQPRPEPPLLILEMLSYIDFGSADSDTVAAYGHIYMRAAAALGEAAQGAGSHPDHPGDLGALALSQVFRHMEAMVRMDLDIPLWKSKHQGLILRHHIRNCLNPSQTVRLLCTWAALVEKRGFNPCPHDLDAVYLRLRHFAPRLTSAELEAAVRAAAVFGWPTWRSTVQIHHLAHEVVHR